MRRLGLQWAPQAQIFQVRQESLEEVKGNSREVFKEELGKFKGPPAKIYVDKDATPKFYKARPVPYVMRGRVEAELRCLQAQVIIESVKHAEWAVPVVPVLKSDNYKLTVNQVSKLEQKSIPKIEDLFASL